MKSTFLRKWSGLVPLATALATLSCGSDDAPPTESGFLSAEPAEPAEEAPPEPAPDADLADGWTLVEGSGYRIGLPPGWLNAQRALEDDEFLADLVDQAAAEDLADLVQESVHNVDLIAFEISELTSDFANNINIFAGERGPLDEPEVFLEQAQEIISTFGGELTGVGEYTVDDLPAVEITYDLPTQDVDVAAIQSYVFGDDHVFVATYTAIEPDPELWRSIIETFSAG